MESQASYTNSLNSKHCSFSQSLTQNLKFEHSHEALTGHKGVTGAHTLRHSPDR